jgi:hypothetical protein
MEAGETGGRMCVSMDFSGEELPLILLLQDVRLGLLLVGRPSSSESSCRRLEQKRPGNWHPALLK